ncbi:anaerobic magnesium-protoporphyrin IX monomethyl ester cyclase [Sphingomonas sp. SORGH_AS 950]|uniref:B12-binding domain-containing radical SAM protein n=1 Tax=Sphingomonas sp. SORGH_AS_0950 TaxID=3041792 RepID=UPI002788D1C3|nr:radical SAM protein [Sphingomonas sp. SORGH_AS_0950]MDQ1159617.1 anaerobic magnesium-protoporphyrin IX monomethyl ester cyclase [Sphingomonas sp. SORGH_AS_0950]
MLHSARTVAVEQKIAAAKCASPRFLLLYPPLQFSHGEVVKPDGSLSLAYLAAALREAGFNVDILDCTVGFDRSPLKESFHNVVEQDNGLLRVGLAAESILKIVEKYDVVGLSSIFTPQTTPCLELVSQIRACFPDKLVIAGGVNARNLRGRFFAAGVDMIAMSEAEVTVTQLGRVLQGQGSLATIPGIAFLDEDGHERKTAMAPAIKDLDGLPMPAWDLLPMQQYWAISRPHGGNFPEGQTIRYASLQTSRGCPFRCAYCHISKEQAGSDYGNIGAFRMKSVERVFREFQTLKDMGVEYVFIEDDSLFMKKRRAIEIFRMVRDLGLKLLDVNGINICHLHRGKQGTDKLQVDTELIEVLAEAGFKSLALPFESASQRLVNKYASSKWRIADTNTADLIRTFNDHGISVSGNYMIGYPDESIEEVFDTITMAKRNVEEGLDYALFFAVVPFPGSELYEIAVRDGHIDREINPDQMRWTKSIMRNMKIDPSTLEHLRQLAWLLVNRSEYVNRKRSMIPEV